MSEEKQNGLVTRIKRVLETHDVEDQALINALILEALASNSQQLDNIRVEAREHSQVHSKISEEHTLRLKEWEATNRKLNDRLDKVEKIVYFPSQHPKRFTGILLGVLFLLNLWFISGFRELFLNMLNAPDWLISFLVPGA